MSYDHDMEMTVKQITAVALLEGLCAASSKNQATSSSFMYFYNISVMLYVLNVPSIGVGAALFCVC